MPIDVTTLPRTVLLCHRGESHDYIPSAPFFEALNKAVIVIACSKCGAVYSVPLKNSEVSSDAG